MQWIELTLIRHAIGGEYERVRAHINLERATAIVPATVEKPKGSTCIMFDGDDAVLVAESPSEIVARCKTCPV